ncbi:Glyoxalase-like domain [Ceraceosorus bombacis]|uniref:Glyoxalase-like domain n=1 Tax=Ceraceosorus bombacis TaxID=401625 RepID=A0A0P1BQ35_9BASI|nr:Glyoxalase-like domain [Ceraceosorus bombacis]
MCAAPITITRPDGTAFSPASVSSRPSTPSACSASTLESISSESTTSDSMACTARKPKVRLMLSNQEQEAWNAAISEANLKITSDANRLPRSTNMGVKGSHLHTTQYVPPRERTWESDETVDRSPLSSPKMTRRAHFSKVIPSLMVTSVNLSLPFYTQVLGFSLVDKPTEARANIVRAVAGEVNGAGRTVRQGRAPIEGVELYLRLPPVGDDGQRERCQRSTLYVAVDDVDAYYKEISTKLDALVPTGEEYFPRFYQGSAKLQSKPQNKASGQREAHVVDSDGNKMIFFTELYR